MTLLLNQNLKMIMHRHFPPISNVAQVVEWRYKCSNSGAAFHFCSAEQQRFVLKISCGNGFV